MPLHHSGHPRCTNPVVPAHAIGTRPHDCDDCRAMHDTLALNPYTQTGPYPNTIRPNKTWHMSPTPDGNMNLDPDTKLMMLFVVLSRIHANSTAKAFGSNPPSGGAVAFALIPKLADLYPTQYASAVGLLDEPNSDMVNAIVRGWSSHYTKSVLQRLAVDHASASLGRDRASAAAMLDILFGLHEIWPADAAAVFDGANLDPRPHSPKTYVNYDEKLDKLRAGF